MRERRKVQAAEGLTKERIKQLVEESQKYYSKAGISPTGEEIANDVASGVEEDIGRDLTDEEFRTVRKLMRTAQIAPGGNAQVVDCTGQVCKKCGSPLQPKTSASGNNSCACPNCDKNLVTSKISARTLFEKYVSKKEKETGPYIPDGEKEQEEDEKEVVKKETKQETQFRKMLKKNPNYKDKAEKDLENFDKDLV